MNVPLVTTNSGFKFLDTPLTQPCLNWHGRVVKAFADCPENLCDLMKRIGVVILAIVAVYPTLALIGLFSLPFQKAGKVQAAESTAPSIKDQLLKKLRSEIESWPQYLKDKNYTRAAYTVKFGNFELKTSRTKESFKAEEILSQVETEMNKYEFTTMPNWYVGILALKDKGSYYSISTKYSDFKDGKSGSGYSNISGLAKKHLQECFPDYKVF